MPQGALGTVGALKIMGETECNYRNKTLKIVNGSKALGPLRALGRESNDFNFCNGFNG